MVLFTALSLSLAWSAEPVEVVQVRAQWTDVTARIAAAWENWRMFSGIFVNPRLPFKMRREHFLGTVY